MKKKLIAKYFVLASILFLVVINSYFSFAKQDNLTKLKFEAASFSQSKSYFARLNLWYTFAHSQDWSTAQKLESGIVASDLLSYKLQYDPIFVQRRAQTISQKKEQSVEDWLELSKIYTILDQPQNAIDALVVARRIDPLRSDLEKIEFEIK